MVALQLVCRQADDWGQRSRDTVTRTSSDLYHVQFAPEDDILSQYPPSYCYLALLTHQSKWNK